MAGNFAYTVTGTTALRSEFQTWLTAASTGTDTKIIKYEELPTTDPINYIRVKILLEVET